MKNCPYCAEEVQDSAVKCRYCGEWLDKEAPDTAPADNPNSNAEAESMASYSDQADNMSPFESLVLRVAGVLFLMEAVVGLVVEATQHKTGYRGSSSNLPVVGDIIIGIGLIRTNGFFRFSRKYVRIWGIIKCFATPLFFAYLFYKSQQGTILPATSITFTFFSVGLLVLLLGAFESKSRLYIGAGIASISLIATIVMVVISNVNQEKAQTFPAVATDQTVVTEWKTYDLQGADIKIDLPAQPRDASQPIPPQARGGFSDTHSFSFQDKGLMILVHEMTPTGKMYWLIKELADAGMMSFKRQQPSLTYKVDVKSNKHAQYNGEYFENNKAFILKGCNIMKTEKPRRLWTVISTYPKDNSDAASASQKALDSVVFAGSSETCK